MRLNYLATSRFPVEEANAVHVVNMCDAFANSTDVCLYAKGAPGSFSGNPVRFDHRLRTVGTRSKPGELQRIAGTVLQLLRRPRDEFVFGRDFYSLMLLALLGRNVFMEIHEPPQSRLRREILKLASARSSLKGIVVITHKLRTYFETELGVDSGKLYVAADCANLPDEHGCPGGAYAIEGSDAYRQVIGYAGSLYPGKGAEFVVDLAASMENDLFVIAGGTQQQVEELKSCATANVRFVGRLQHEAVAGFLEACDVLVAPYKKSVKSAGGNDIGSWMSPLKIFEYMSSGVPMVVSDLEVIREVVVDGENGLLAMPEVVSDWVSKLNALAESPELAARLSVEGKKCIREKYNWDNRARELLEFFTDRLST